MDRIRKALDLARMERAQRLGGEPGSHEVSATPVADLGGARTAHRPEASRTRAFQPSPEVLERHRILPPDAQHGAAVAYRMLRTQVLQRLDAHGWRSIAVFSPGPGEGKTTTAANLAISLASDHLHSVLLIEFDFKRPMLARRFGFEPELGTDDVVRGAAQVHDCLYRPEGYERLIMMPARSPLANSSELLAGPKSRQIVSEVRNRYPERIVLFDLPPVLTADDALAFAPQIECGLVVAAEGRTRRRDLVRTIELLHKIPIVGTVLNRAADAPSGY